MTQTSQMLTTPITAAQVRNAPLATTEVRTHSGRVLVPAGKLNWAFHGTHEGDAEGFADWCNTQAGR